MPYIRHVMAGPALRIIVADDNADQVLTLAALLEDAGHVVRTFRTGAGLLEAIEQFQADVCILDIEMPMHSGYAVAGQLKSRYGSVRPFLVAISGKWYRAADQLLAKSCGFDEFLEKPADARQLMFILAGVRQRLAPASAAASRP